MISDLKAIVSKLTKYLPSLAGFLVATLFAYYTISTPINERTLDWKVYDFYSSYYPHSEPNNSIIIIDIDDQSIEAIGQWPWPRFQIAEALRIIIEGMPSSILMDILLSEKDRTSLVNIQQLFASQFAIDLDLMSIPQALKDYDTYFSQVIDGAPVILPSLLSQHKVSQQVQCVNRYLEKSSDKSINVDRGGNSLTNLNLEYYNGIICPLRQFYQHSASTGFINPSIDKDGLVRRIPIVKQYNNQLIPSLSLAGLTVTLGSEFTIKNRGLGATVQLHNNHIPVDQSGDALLNFRGKGRHYQTIPMLKLLSGTISPDYFTGKIVLLGATASALNDVSNTYLDPVFPNIELHATLIDNVISGDVLTLPVWFEQLESIMILVIGALLSLLMARKNVTALNISAVSLFCMLLILPPILLYNAQVYLSPFISIVSLITSFIVMTTLKYYRSERQLASVQNAIANANLSIIDCMATVAELRDSETGGHITRTRLYVKTLIKQLQKNPKYKHEINDDYIQFVSAASPLHDIGKVGIPDHILLKPGKLSTDELVIMRTHAALGGDILRQTIKKLGPNPYLNIAVEIANYHHEKWDGSGYPLGLKGDAIPLSARVMAVADVFDALINKRIYKNAVSFEDTFSYIKQASGEHFDPDVVDAFIEIKKDLLYIAQTIDD
ncbi:CHASE2 domain-containing protein [Psychromonas sp. 14N.309.X.WAT.B.A12]|uniref:CHASE2 domain-containing protein n=1 Tax=Psychromonas sp. 14N.309.X.WAT.B.A12 TaxID=2998322 RepID=UPI0025AFC343|nr:CHASE2 domain-containing protein [Psychromonas sp. 14N.309.X.WAT.B.A12]MDN2662281.1 CHASE2 domain-containing protein [Psychromonas sp. 14N.309.X.WAT.B.A12]